MRPHATYHDDCLIGDALAYVLKINWVLLEVLKRRRNNPKCFLLLASLIVASSSEFKDVRTVALE